jgi:hypothetical protein
MQIEGDALIAVLNHQSTTVNVWHEQDEVSPNCDPRLAARIAAAGNYIGFGSTGRNGRVRYIRPRGVALSWLAISGGSHTTQRPRNAEGALIAPGYVLEHRPLLRIRG